MNDGRSHASRGQIIAAFASIYVIWGSTYLAIMYAVETIPPFLMGGVRFLISGTLLYLWSRYRGAPKPTRIHWRNAIVAGGFLLLGGNGAVVWAEQFVPSGLTALLVSILPLLARDHRVGAAAAKTPERSGDGWIDARDSWESLCW